MCLHSHDNNRKFLKCILNFTPVDYQLCTLIVKLPVSAISGPTFWKFPLPHIVSLVGVDEAVPSPNLLTRCVEGHDMP